MCGGLTRTSKIDLAINHIYKPTEFFEKACDNCGEKFGEKKVFSCIDCYQSFCENDWKDHIEDMDHEIIEVNVIRHNKSSL